MKTPEAISKVGCLVPNTGVNARCPWKGDKRVTRMSCPVHRAHWVRLLVSSDESGEVILQCEAGCTQEEVEMFIFDAGARLQNWRQWPLDDDPVEPIM